jgi:hypothetical protein
MEERNSDSSVILQAYPTNLPSSEYKPEMMKDLMWEEWGSTIKVDPTVASWSRWAFNFSLPVDWRTDPRNTAFSFTAQFPKCALWLTHPTSSAHWLSLERGVLCAIKGKNNPQGANNVVHKTLKHDTLHAVFADMEEQLILPVSWNYKPTGKKK